MNYLKTATKQEPCPTCASTDGCKELKGKWLCRNKHGVLDDLPLFGVINGFKLIGKKDWLAFVPCDEEGAFKPRQAKKEIKVTAEDTLSAKQRDLYYRRIIDHLFLSKKHEQKLLERGLTYKQIKELGFVSIEKGGSSLPPSIPTSIPGVFSTYYGKQIGSKYNYGYIIWCKNERNQIIGYQIALDDELLKEGFPKYRWATSKKKGEIVASQHLKGEMPINYQGEGRDTLYIVDSIPKVNYTAFLHNIDVVGAGGNGHLQSSKNQFKQLLEANNYKAIINAVDAGDIENINTMRGLVKDYNLCQQFGYEMQVLWWGQTTKGRDKDIDELDNLECATIISFEDFIGFYTGEKKDDLISRISTKKGLKKEKKKEAIESDDNFLFYQDKETFLDGLEKEEFKEITQQFDILLEPFFKKKAQKSIENIIKNTDFIYQWSPDLELPNFDALPQGTTIKVILPQKYKQHRIKALNDLRSKTKFIFDNSQTGSGKSHGIKNLDKVLYLDNNYKNPSIEGIKEMPFLSPRSQHGLYFYEGQIYNDPDLEKREEGEKINKGNCFLKPIFRSHEEKGYKAEENKYLCDVCPYSAKCTKSQDDLGLYGFRAVRRQALNEIKTSGQGRVHPSQLQAKEIKSNFKDYTLVIEEAGSLTNIDKIIFKESDFNVWYREINKKELSPKVKEYALKLVDSLINLLNACQRHKDHRYGLTHKEILKALPKEDLISSEIKELQSLALIPSSIFEGLKENQVVEENSSKEEKAKTHQRNATLNEFKREETNQALRSLPKNIGLIFDILYQGTDNNSCFSIEFDKENKGYFFSVNRFDARIREIAKVSHCMVFLDATATEAQLRGLYGLENETMVIFQEEICTLENIKAFNINTPGLASNQKWTDHRINSLKEMIKQIKKESPDKKFAIICPKKYGKHLKTPFYYGRHDRGSNELKNYDGLIFVGCPMPNLGAQQIEYDLIYGDSNFDFTNYYTQVIKENRIQGLGRHRAQWKKDKQLIQYYFSTDEDLSYFEDYGVNLKNYDYTDLFPHIAPKSSLARIKLVLENIFATTKELKNKITQTEIAKRIGVSPQSISQTLRSKFGGNWEAFFTLQQSLYSIYKGLFKIPSEVWEKITPENDRLLKLLKDDPTKAVSDFLQFLQKGDDDPVFWLVGLPDQPHSHYFTALRFINLVCSIASPWIKQQLKLINKPIRKLGLI